MGEYKEKWEWEEAKKDPGGELMQRLMGEKADADLKASKRKKPEKHFNQRKTNNPELTVMVTNLGRATTENMIRSHFDASHKVRTSRDCTSLSAVIFFLPFSVRPRDGRLPRFTYLILPFTARLETLSDAT